MPPRKGKEVRRVNGLTVTEIVALSGLSLMTVHRRVTAGESYEEIVGPRRRPRTHPKIIAGDMERDHALRLGLQRGSVFSRLKNGWTEEEATTTPRIDPGPRLPPMPTTGERPAARRASDELDDAIVEERLCEGGPMSLQAEIAARFGVTRQAVSLRERALRGEG